MSKIPSVIIDPSLQNEMKTLEKSWKMLKLNEPDTCDENDSAMPNLSHPWRWGSYTWTTFES